MTEAPPLRILHVVQGYTPGVGGTERVIQRLSEELVSQFGDETLKRRSFRRTILNI